MVFNPDLTKRAQEVVFSRKPHFPKHLYFNNFVREKVKTQKLRAQTR